MYLFRIVIYYGLNVRGTIITDVSSLQSNEE